MDRLGGDEDIGDADDEQIEPLSRVVNVESVAVHKQLSRQMILAIHGAGSAVPQTSETLELHFPNTAAANTTFIKHALVQELHARLGEPQDEVALMQMADAITLEKADEGHTLRLPASYAYRLAKAVNVRELSGEGATDFLSV